ncbi:MAG: ComA-related protein, partial [uncultured Rubrobacteraceae bacterium]
GHDRGTEQPQRGRAAWPDRTGDSRRRAGEHLQPAGVERGASGPERVPARCDGRGARGHLLRLRHVRGPARGGLGLHDDRAQEQLSRHRPPGDDSVRGAARARRAQ